ncbi:MULTISPECIES: glycosyltransferase [Spirulina sp. CCY15215]|uniref:glycosyltransferase n=1 Tax=Spirulina sp. CCY15215 TaxID=2767591 RepID=UPI001951E1D8|nr:glycosyltransferase [Spirulina major]
MVYRQDKRQNGILDRRFLPLRVVHLSAKDMGGGAPNATYRLHSELHRLGYDSTLFVLEKLRNDCSSETLGDRATQQFCPTRVDQENAANLPLQTNTIHNTLFSSDRSPYTTELLQQLPEAEIINLHWIAGFVDYQTFFSKIPTLTPIIWRLSDENPLTGGCHVDNFCDRFTQSCGMCPQLNSTQENDLSRQIWESKKKAIKNVARDRLHFVAPSQWMTQKLKQSSLFRDYPVTTIPTGIDTDNFAPRDRLFAREVLGLPKNAKVVLFVADYLANPIKNFNLLREALSNLSRLPNLYLLSLGRGNSSLPVSIPHLHLGFIENERLLSLVYSAADLFVISSKQDNFPNVVLESLACGTPVVGTNVGGIPDLVRPNLTGSLVSPENSQELSRAIASLLKDSDKLTEFSSHCRRIALAEYTLEQQARRYIELYHQTGTDIITLGDNWYDLETFAGETFRWVNNDAEIRIYNPTGDLKTLRLLLEPGPSLRELPLTLHLQDHQGKTILTLSTHNRETLYIQLPIISRRSTSFKLHCQQESKPLSSDSRILNFRVFDLGWSN